tara:strand:- start:35 stop:148 length:114 start_codon:yes stop_codon:yes gene_type:complete
LLIEKTIQKSVPLKVEKKDPLGKIGIRKTIRYIPVEK